MKERLVKGIGINDADYKLNEWSNLDRVDGKQKQKLIWRCPFYKTWMSMLNRCYSKKFLEKNPTYSECSVSENWLRFSNFKSWMETQDWENKYLDKDLLVEGNKVYCEATCIFVTRRINNFIQERGAGRGPHPIGVSLNKASQKYESYCEKATGGRKFLGLFDCPNKAHDAWLAFKLEQAIILVNQQEDQRLTKALIERYTNYKTKEIQENKYVTI